MLLKKLTAKIMCVISQVVFDFCTLINYLLFQTDLSTPHQTINRESTLKKTSIFMVMLISR